MMHDTTAFKKCAKRYRNLLQEIEALKADMRELEAETKEKSGATNMDIRAMKRWLKADVNGKTAKLIEETDNEAAIADLLGLSDKPSVDKKIVEGDTFDPETGEVYETGPAVSAEMSPCDHGDGAVQDGVMSTAPTHPVAKADDDEDRVAVERAEAEADAPDVSESVSRGEPEGERERPVPPGITPAADVSGGVTSPGGENPAPDSESREGEHAPEATVDPAQPTDHETAATDSCPPIPYIADRRNWIDGKPPGVAA